MVFQETRSEREQMMGKVSGIEVFCFFLFSDGSMDSYWFGSADVSVRVIRNLDVRYLDKRPFRIGPRVIPTSS